MKTAHGKIKIDSKKNDVVLIGNSFDLLDIVEIFLYKKYNVIAAMDEFEGMQKIKNSNPICIFIKVSDNINPVLSLLDKLTDKNLKNIPVIAFTKDEITAINKFELKNSGVKEIIKFPINQNDFLEIIQPIIQIKN